MQQNSQCFLGLSTQKALKGEERERTKRGLSTEVRRCMVGDLALGPYQEDTLSGYLQNPSQAN
jgi:hypothetical protein